MAKKYYKVRLPHRRGWEYSCGWEEPRRWVTWLCDDQPPRVSLSGCRNGEWIQWHATKAAAERCAARMERLIPRVWKEVHILKPVRWEGPRGINPLWAEQFSLQHKWAKTEWPPLDY